MTCFFVVSKMVEGRGAWKVHFPSHVPSPDSHASPFTWPFPLLQHSPFQGLHAWFLMELWASVSFSDLL